ncbi:MAG: anthranilate phosphoribosyltransferase [Proteobacteria bacterium]|nr:anthranilate phosphoribosyltransferase [Pseudomonadota bacterium]
MPTGDFKGIIASIAQGERLDVPRAQEAFDIMMSGEATEAQIGAFLMGLRLRGETVDEITGGVLTMRAKVMGIDAPAGAIDTCGTGGDASGTYNISTATSFVVAGLGVPVAKHGNRALSSKSGAADVLQALGVNIDAHVSLIRKSLWEANICFLMATRHHGAMRHVGPARAELGTRTIFNLLGPLSNPAGAKRQLVGVFSRDWVEPLAQVLGRLGSERAWVVHGSDGLDELTTTGPSFVAELKDGKVSTFEVTPADADLPAAKPEELKGGDAETNALAINALIDGHLGPFRDIVLLNAAAALIVAGRAEDLKSGAEMAAGCLDSGKAREALEALVQITNLPAPADSPEPTNPPQPK